MNSARVRNCKEFIPAWYDHHVISERRLQRQKGLKLEFKASN